MITLEEVKAGIFSLELDDFIDKDPILEAIYDRFINIQEVHPDIYCLERDMVNYFREANFIYIKASRDKHPELSLDSKYIESMDSSITTEDDVLAVLFIVYTMLALTVDRPKHLERLKDVLYMRLSRDYPSFMATFNQLVGEQKNLGRKYVMDCVKLPDGTYIDIYSADWAELTNNFDENLTMKYIFGNATFSGKMRVMKVITQRFLESYGNEIPDKRYLRFLEHNELLTQSIESQYQKKLKKNEDSVVSSGLIPKNMRSKKPTQADVDVEEELLEGLIPDDLQKATAEIESLKQQLANANGTIEELKMLYVEPYKEEAEEKERQKTRITELESALNEKFTDKQDNTMKGKCLVVEMLLEKLGVTTANTDLSKIARLAAYLTGTTEKHSYKIMQPGITLSEYHAEEIKKVNKIMQELNIDISL